jgi:hypothetical protein
MRHNFFFECQHAQLLEAKDPGKGEQGIWEVGDLQAYNQLDPSGHHASRPTPFAGKVS